MTAFKDALQRIGEALDAAEVHADTLTDPTELSVLHEAASDLIASMERRVVRARALRAHIAARMVAQMGEGEAVVCPSSGRVAFIGPVSTKAASVRKDAVDEHARDLPEALRPKTFTKYPTVTDLKRAVRHGDIDRSTFQNLVDDGETEPGLRWRTLDGIEAA